MPEIDWSASQSDIITQLATIEDEAARTYLERELWSFRQAYASVGQGEQVRKLQYVNMRAFPNSVMRRDELFTHTVGAFPVVPPNLSAAAFAKLSWGILLWFGLVAVSVVGTFVTLVR